MVIAGLINKVTPFHSLKYALFTISSLAGKNKFDFDYISAELCIMKTYSQFQGIVSVILLFCIMIEFTGCYSKRILTTSEINQSDYYLIFDKGLTYTAFNVTISDGLLSGNLDFNNKNFADPRYIHIYLLSDSLLTVNNDRISLPVNSINSIRQQIYSSRKTTILKAAAIIIAGSAVTVLGVLAAIELFKVFEDAFYCNERYP
jgi:hypothetical protein